MTLDEMKLKVLALIEEVDEESETLTNDPDIAAKINDVINQVQYELSRVKKIPAYKEIEVDTDTRSVYTYDDIDTENKVYQLANVTGVDNELKANGTVIKFLDSGTAEIEYYKYPKRIDKDTEGTHELEVSDDVLEIMPYGVAADILKSDISNAYGNVYANRYDQLRQEMDIRYHTGSIEFEEGV